MQSKGKEPLISKGHKATLSMPSADEEIHTHKQEKPTLAEQSKAKNTYALK